MASGTRIPKAELTGIYRAMIKRMSRKMPPTVTDELSARLLDRLAAPALVELTAIIALTNFVTRTNTAFGIESQGFAAACELKPLAVAAAA